MPPTPEQPRQSPPVDTALRPHEEDIEADPSDIDSAFSESDISSLNTSLSSSVTDYVYENGRRYHRFREGQYLFPNDETEQDRLDMVHHIFRLMLRGSLIKAPVPQSLQRILDIGTGTGIWALDVADEFPSADVLAIDLSPIQPQWSAPNCHFVVDDVEDAWPYPESRLFDYVHQRNMVGSIADWDRIFQQALQHMKPGGFYEIQEFRVWFYSQEHDPPKDSSIEQWQRLLTEGTTRFGKSLNIVEKLADKMKDAGFVNVREDVIKVPIGPWPKDPSLKTLGQWMQVHAVESVEPLTLALFTRVLGWSEFECRVLIAKVQKEFRERRQLYVYAHFIYGQKPTV
ncbi:S-adenosyl-L-methionine-dependent methyltransferase [Aspergillus varians]